MQHILTVNINTTILDNFLKDKAYEIAINPKYDRYQRGLVSVVYTLFDKKIRLGVTSNARENVTEVLAQELHKPVTKIYKKSFCYNYGHNILSPFYTLQNFLITKSEAKHEY